MIFSVTMYQWLLEVGLNVGNIFYFYFVYGNSIILDRCHSMILGFFGLIVQPAFMFMGDFQFRRKYNQEGIIKALKYELFQESKS